MKADLMTYGQDFSLFMNHASHYVPGIEFSTGALGLVAGGLWSVDGSQNERTHCFCST